MAKWEDDVTAWPEVPFYRIHGEAPRLVAVECPLCGEMGDSIQVEYKAEDQTITRYEYQHRDGRVCVAPVS